MARRSWEESFAEAHVPTVVQTPGSYLMLARKCMENVQTMTSQTMITSVQFNRAQCEYLAKKLEVSIPSAEYWWAQLNSSDFKSKLNSELNSECFEVMKLLYRTAKEVERFIQGCRRDNWLQAAMVLANMSLYVSSLGSNLNFCMLLFGHKGEYNALGEGLNWENQLDAVSPVLESNEEQVSLDERNLLTRLEGVILSTNASDEERQLAKCLSGRLREHLRGYGWGPVQLDVWNIGFSSLRHVQRLGSGSAGMVNKSMWLAGQIEVAEKVFYGSDHPSFMNEVELLVRLAHPNIVPLLGYAMDERSCSIVMELMDGDLFILMQARLRENREPCEFPFTIFEAVDLMLQIALGMLYLHEENVVHRDLKSQNILVKRRKDIDAECIHVKVADFGLSKTKESSSTYSHQTMNTGTTRWMAPELMTIGVDDLLVTTSDHDRKLRYPFKVDVYSFGMVCYEILSGKVPFSTISSLREVKKMVLNGDRPVLPDQCPHVLKTLIHSCWVSEASSRPSFVEICRRLKHLKYSLMTVFSSRLFQAPENRLIPRQLHNADDDSTMPRVFTMAECEKHKDSKDCWLVIDGKVYDVTQFLDDHPGGDEVILEVAGRDATDDFNDIGHTTSAVEMMAEYLIGDIDGYIHPNMWVCSPTRRCSKSRWRRQLRRVWF